jgi:hypothetical protein
MICFSSVHVSWFYCPSQIVVHWCFRYIIDLIVNHQKKEGIGSVRRMVLNMIFLRMLNAVENICLEKYGR